MVVVFPPEVTCAIEDARALQAEADANWPNGYNRDAVKERATSALTILDAYCAAGVEAMDRIKAVRAQLEDAGVQVAW